MKTVKTSELTGAALDWVVANCEDLKTKVEIEGIVWLLDSRGDISRNFNPSSSWVWGGPIIEREEIMIDPPRSIAFWSAEKNGHLLHGHTPLIAAMRCYVASKLGDTLEIHEEFI